MEAGGGPNLGVSGVSDKKPQRYRLWRRQSTSQPWQAVHGPTDDFWSMLAALLANQNIDSRYDYLFTEYRVLPEEETLSLVKP